MILFGKESLKFFALVWGGVSVVFGILIWAEYWLETKNIFHLDSFISQIDHLFRVFGQYRLPNGETATKVNSGFLLFFAVAGACFGLSVGLYNHIKMRENFKTT